MWEKSLSSNNYAVKSHNYEIQSRNYDMKSQKFDALSNSYDKKYIYKIKVIIVTKVSTMR